MANNRILAPALIVVGLILLFFAYRSFQSLGDQLTEAVTGRFTDSTIWYLTIGAVSVMAGVGLLLPNKLGAK